MKGRILAHILILFKKHKKKCFYCGKETKLQSLSRKGIQKSNNATIEHIYSKLDIRRNLNKHTVLACYECNSTKSHNDFNEIYNNDIYKDAFYRTDEKCIYNGLILTMCQSKNVEKYLQ